MSATEEVVSPSRLYCAYGFLHYRRVSGFCGDPRGGSGRQKSGCEGSCLHVVIFLSISGALGTWGGSVTTSSPPRRLDYVTWAGASSLLQLRGGGNRAPSS